MLSHFMGGFNRQSAKELWQAERENHQLADKLASHRRRAQEDLAARDQRIAEPATSSPAAISTMPGIVASAGSVPHAHRCGLPRRTISASRRWSTR
jgi:hypothetical protein